MNRPHRTARQSMAIGSMLVALLIGVIGCGRDSAPVSPSSNSDGPRIVSLTPAVTQMLIDLGRTDQIVGVGQYDPAAPEQRPVVGDLLNIDYEKLLAVRPTHVFIQPEREIGTPEKLQRLAAERNFAVHAFRIDGLDDITHALHNNNPDAPSLAQALNAPDPTRKLAERIGTRLQRLRKWTADRDRPRTLLVYRLEPLGVVGRNTYLDQMLNIAGGTNALDGESYQTIDREKLLAIQPDAIVLMTSPGQATKKRIASWKQTMGGIDIPAGRNGRIHVVRDPLALLPSSSVPRIAAELTRRLHPGLADRIDQMLASQDAKR